MARESAPTIIFMDEVDSIGGSRGGSGKGGGESGDSEVQRTMMELLNQLDGFESSSQIKILMATNRIDILDSALLRPGRIDRKIEFPAPNAESRHHILKIHSRRMSAFPALRIVHLLHIVANCCPSTSLSLSTPDLERGIDLKVVAEKMDGASGADMSSYSPSPSCRCAATDLLFPHSHTPSPTPSLFSPRHFSLPQRASPVKRV